MKISDDMKQTFWKRLPGAAVIIYFGIFMLLVAALGAHWHFAIQPDPQPIAFSHRLHLGSVGLKCDYCHQHTASSPRAARVSAM